MASLALTRHADKPPAGSGPRGPAAPSSRLLLAGTGAALALYGARRGDRAGSAALVAGLLLALAGLLLRGRAAALAEFDDGIDVEQSIHIALPPERLFELWSEGECLAHGLSHVKEVRPLGDQRWHWIVEGPGGMQLEWISQLTDRVPPHLLSWCSLPEAEIEQRGRVRFTPARDGGTRLDIRLSYRARADVLGNAVAMLLSRHPHRQLREDLRRLKRFVEGTPPALLAAPAGSGRLPISLR